MFKLTEIDKNNDLLRFESLDRTEVAEVFSDHQQECREEHYLDFSQLSIGDFEGLIFDLYSDSFFERVEEYGIRLVSIDGQSISIAGYAHNNGYYSDKLTLVIRIKNDKNEVITKEYDITSCQYNKYVDW